MRQTKSKSKIYIMNQEKNYQYVISVQIQSSFVKKYNEKKEKYMTLTRTVIWSILIFYTTICTLA